MIGQFVCSRSTLMKLEKRILTLMSHFSRVRRRKRELLIPFKIEVLGLWSA